MRDPRDPTDRPPTETLQIGPSRPPLSQQVPARWRPPAVALFGFALGVAAGAGAVLGWPAPEGLVRTAPRPFHVDEHAVTLMLFDVVPPRTDPSGRASENDPLQIDGALFLAGAVTSTVVGVDNLDRSLEVRVPALPVTVSRTARLQSVDLEIIVRDCRAASRWPPVDRPFTITWRDEDGKSHLDRAGDFDRSLARSVIHYIDAVCGQRRW